MSCLSSSDPPNPFTQFYAQLLHQGNMLADSVRTAAYQNAIFLNSESDFRNKVVLDVGEYILLIKLEQIVMPSVFLLFSTSFYTCTCTQRVRHRNWHSRIFCPASWSR